MINQRLIYFWNRSVDNLKTLLKPDGDSGALIDKTITTSMNSPRELIRILDTILREHDEHEESKNELLSGDSVERGLDKYAREFVENRFDATIPQQFLRLGLTEFTNKDIQSAFRINEDSARNKIRNWVDAGLVKQIGTRASGEAGGKPAHEFALTDERLRRVVAKKLTSLATFDANEDPPEE